MFNTWQALGDDKWVFIQIFPVLIRLIPVRIIDAQTKDWRTTTCVLFISLEKYLAS